VEIIIILTLSKIFIVEIKIIVIIKMEEIILNHLKNNKKPILQKTTISVLHLTQSPKQVQSIMAIICPKID
jgi:hypothetical protein